MHWENLDNWRIGFGYWIDGDVEGWEIYFGRKVLCFFDEYL
jgi:hypothetical protein